MSSAAQGWRDISGTVSLSRPNRSPRWVPTTRFQPADRGSPTLGGGSGRSTVLFGAGVNNNRGVWCDYPVAAMFNVRPRKPAQPLRDATAQPLRLGAAVRLRGRGVTSVVIGNSPDIDRVRVRWDGTDEVTHCLRASLEQAR